MSDNRQTDRGLTATGIDHIVLYVRDPAVSRAFYVDLLGMTVRREYPDHIFLHCGAQLIGLFRTRNDEGFTTGRDINHLAFSVERGSYEDITATLEDAGIPFCGRSGDEYCIYFDDPDGHRLQIVIPD